MSWEFNGQKLTEMDRIIEDSHRFYSKYCEKCKSYSKNERKVINTLTNFYKENHKFIKL